VKEQHKSDQSRETNLTLEVINDAKIEVLSQLSALVNAVQKCRPKSTGSYALASGSEMDEWIKRIEEEKRKVEALQLTLAFVGTMKAGKSTTINAIVGCEVLPNRNTPMTILPTVITHTPGYHEPVLSFAKRKPFDEAIKAIKTRLNSLDKKTGREYTLSDDENPTLSRIRSGQLCQLEEEYRGQACIYEFMKSINDIARICTALNVDNPLDHYFSVDEFPQIAIEFSCLKNRVKMELGKLSLIDTPGPNEAGQGHLKAVVKEQLSRASAIVSVLDFSQLKSEADDELRRWVVEAQKSSGVKLYVFVNKFDQKKRNDVYADESRLKALVCKELYPERPEPDGTLVSVVDGQRVFPISALYAFFGNRASREIESRGALPKLEDADWVEGFARLAYSMEWEDDIQSQDTEKHREASKKLWKTSRMEEPLNQVIAESMERVVPFCLNAALTSVKTTATGMQNGLTVRRKSLDLALHDLEAAVKRMDDRLKLLDAVQKDAMELKKVAIGNLKEGVATEFDKLRRGAAGVLKRMAKAQGEALEKKQKTEEDQSNNIFFQYLNNLGKGHSDKAEKMRLVLTGDEPLDFDDEDEANRFLTHLHSTVLKATKRTFDEALSRLQGPINSARRDLKISIQERIQPILDDMGKDAQSLFGIQFRVPPPKYEEMQLDFGEIERQHVKKHQVRNSYTERRWYTFWCYEHKVSYTADVYRVKPVEIRESIDQRIEGSLKQVREMLNSYIQDVFHHHAEKYFSQVGQAFQHLQTSVTDGIKLKKLEQEQQNKVAREIEEVSIDLNDVAKRAEDHTEHVNEQLAFAV